MFDRYTDLTEQLDRQLLSRPEPPSHADAGRLLKSNGIAVRKVVWVDPNAILYVTDVGVPMTAWLHVLGGKPELTFEPGFPAEAAFVDDRPEEG